MQSGKLRLQIQLNPDEAKALERLCAVEIRGPRAQIRMIVRSELERRGLLPSQDPDPVEGPAGGVEAEI